MINKLQSSETTIAETEQVLERMQEQIYTKPGREESATAYDNADAFNVWTRSSISGDRLDLSQIGVELSMISAMTASQRREHQVLLSMQNNRIIASDLTIGRRDFVEHRFNPDKNFIGAAHGHPMVRGRVMEQISLTDILVPAMYKGNFVNIVTSPTDTYAFISDGGEMENTLKIRVTMAYRNLSPLFSDDVFTIGRVMCDLAGLPDDSLLATWERTLHQRSIGSVAALAKQFGVQTYHAADGNSVLQSVR